VFVSPKGNRLDNTAFSTDKFLNKTIISIRNLQSLQRTYTHTTHINDNLYGMIFICRIALHGGRQVEKRAATINTSKHNRDD
jgi:hypothetical protein